MTDELKTIADHLNAKIIGVIAPVASDAAEPWSVVIERMVVEMRTAVTYLETIVICKVDCDPVVGLHRPECGLLNGFKNALKEYDDAEATQA